MAKNTLYTENDFVDVYDANGVKLDSVPKAWVGTDLLPAGVTDKAPKSDDDVKIPDGDPSEDWTVPQLTAWATKQEPPVDLGGATKKDDIVAIVVKPAV